MKRNIAIVAGATGLTGQYLLNVLAEDSFYDEVIALTRRPLSAAFPKVRAIPADYATLTPEQIPGATHLFCCLGTTIAKAGSREAFRQVDHDFVLNFARAGHRAGARRLLLVSSAGAGPGAGSFYLRTKGDVEQEVAKLDWEALHIFRPGVLLGRREEDRPGEQFAARLARAFESMLAGPLRKYRAMPAGLLASAMAAAGERGPAGRHIFHYDGIIALS